MQTEADRPEPPATVISLREQMDEIDRRLLYVLSERGRLVQRIQKLKSAKDRIPTREAEILTRLAEQNSGPYPNETIRCVWNALFEAAPDLPEGALGDE